MPNDSRPPLILLHGAGAGAWQWQRWIDVFTAAGWPSQAIDLQPAAAGLAQTRLSDYRQQVHEAVHACDLPPVLIGASLGGLLALLAAAACPVSALLLINPVPPGDFAHKAGLRLPAGEIMPWRTQARWESSRRSLGDDDPAGSLWAFRRWRDESAAVLREVAAGVDWQTPACPCLVMLSAQDEDIAPDSMRAFADAIAASRLLLPGNHLQPLLGAAAAHWAVLAVGWLNAVFQFRTD